MEYKNIILEKKDGIARLTLTVRRSMSLIARRLQK